MKYDTAGNKIYEMTSSCNCGLTCGCKQCNPQMFEMVLYPIGNGINDYYQNKITAEDEKNFYKFIKN